MEEIQDLLEGFKRTPKILAAKADEALSGPPASAEIDVNGAQKTIELLKHWIEKGR